MAKRTGYLIKALTDHLVESQKITIKEAQKSLDGEYVRGYVMFLAPPYETKCASTNVTTEHPKSQMRIFGSKRGSDLWAPDLARSVTALKDFKWDEHPVAVNEIGDEV